MLHRTGVGDLLDGRLGQGGLDRQGFPWDPGAEHGLDAGGGVFEGRAGGVQVEGGDAPAVARGGVGDGEQESTVAWLAAANWAGLKVMAVSKR